MSPSKKIEREWPRYGNKCPVCKARIVGRKAVFQRHVERHAKLAELEILNEKIEIERAEDPGFDVDLARDMYMSTPAKYRYTGGAFKTGPLADKGVAQGLPKVFFETGRVRRCFEWIKSGLKPERFAFRALKDTNATTETAAIDEKPTASRKRKAEVMLAAE